MAVCCAVCGHWLQPRDLVSASVGGQICKEQIEREIGDGKGKGGIARLKAQQMDGHA